MEKQQREATAADAFQVVSDAGLMQLGLHDRIAATLRMPRWLLLALEGAVVIASIAAIWYWQKPLPILEVPVAVLLPSEEALSVKSNMERQRHGFFKAWDENRIDPASRHMRYYHFPLQPGDPNSAARTLPASDNAPPLEDLEQVMHQFQDWYDQGIRVFIVTMSGSAISIGERFAKWVKDMPDRDRPVLVATVASAPRIANSEHGIFRHYIRSEDESGIFSRYIDQRAENMDYEVVLVQIQDEYGDHARRTLERDNGLKLKGIVKIPISLDQADYPEIIDLNFTPGADTYKFVVVVGYGDMIKGTLETLRIKAERHALQSELPLLQEVLVVSTFTEPSWQPPASQFDQSIYRQVRTLGPVMGVEKRRGIGVVYQFSLLTLDKAIYCTRQQRDKWRGPNAFSSCWEDPDSFASLMAKDMRPIIELLANGDAHIPLQVLQMNEL